MNPRIEQLRVTPLVGIHRKMSLGQNETAALWRQFMPRRGEIGNRTTTDYISMQIYPRGLAPEQLFAPALEFEKWATVEVMAHDDVPPGMEAFTLPGGEYAVFQHKGPASAAPEIMHFIFAQWLPESDFQLDDRPHFEILPENYSPMDPNAQEEIWIPVKPA